MRHSGDDQDARLLSKAEPRAPSNPFARQRSLTCRDRAKRKKTLCAPREPQKVLVVELLCSTRCTGCPYVEHRVGGLIGPLKAGNLLPF